MISKITTLEDLKAMYVEMLLDKTDKISKVDEGSVLNAIAYGVAKVAQKCLKEVAVLETHLFPDMAYGAYLDEIAQLNGIPPRFGAVQSSGYIRLVGDIGTTYVAGVHTFTGNHGIIFDLVENVVIGNTGFAYAKIRSQSSGENTNVDPLTLINMIPSLSGHKYCVNEYNTIGGADNEDDELFKKRIKNNANILARGTVAMLEQVYNKLNNNIMRIFFLGINQNSKVSLGIITQNGADLSNSELNDLIVRGQQFLNLTELKPDNNFGYNLELKNMEFHPVDVSARVELEPAYNIDDVRVEIQIRLNKYIDYRFWELGRKVEWDDLLQIVKTTPGVKYVYDNFFFPNADIEIFGNKLPRIRGFLLLDASGNIIQNISGTLNPVYYPPKPDFLYQSNVLKTI